MVDGAVIEEEALGLPDWRAPGNPEPECVLFDGAA